MQIFSSCDTHKNRFFRINKIVWKWPRNKINNHKIIHCFYHLVPFVGENLAKDIFLCRHKQYFEYTPPRESPCFYDRNGVWGGRFLCVGKRRGEKNLMLIRRMLKLRASEREKRKNIKKKNRAWWLLSPTFKFPITFRCLHFFPSYFPPPLFTHLSNVLIILILSLYVKIQK
jgi:hypothetical protein